MDFFPFFSFSHSQKERNRIWHKTKKDKGAFFLMTWHSIASSHLLSMSFQSDSEDMDPTDTTPTPFSSSNNNSSTCVTASKYSETIFYDSPRSSETLLIKTSSWSKIMKEKIWVRKNVGASKLFNQRSGTFEAATCSNTQFIFFWMSWYETSHTHSWTWYCLNRIAVWIA